MRYTQLSITNLSSDLVLPYRFVAFLRIILIFLFLILSNLLLGLNFQYREISLKKKRKEKA